MATNFIDPSADGANNAWTKSTGSSASALLDDAVRQPTAPTTGSDRITSSTAGQLSDLVFPNTLTHVAGSTYTLWVHATPGNRRGADTLIAVDDATFANSAATVPAQTPAAAQAWYSRDVSALIDSQAKLDGFRARLSCSSVAGGGATACAINAVYLEQVTGTDHTQNPGDTPSVTDAAALSFGKAASDSARIAEDALFAWTLDRRDGSGVSVADAVGFDRSLAFADGVSLADLADPQLEGAGDRELTPSDGVSTSDAAVFDRGLALPDTASVTDAASLERTLSFADGVTLSDDLSRVVDAARSVSDSATAADSASLASELARSFADGASTADNADVQKFAGGIDHELNFDDGVTISVDVALARGIVRTLDDTVGIADSLARAMEANRLFADAASVADSALVSSSFIYLDPIYTGRITGTNGGSIGERELARIGDTVAGLIEEDIEE